MKTLVLVKPVPDLAQLSVSRGQGRIFEKGRRLMNPLDAPAVQAAVDAGGPVVAMSVAHPDDVDGLRRALAMGAAEAVLVAHADAREWDEAMVVGAILAVRGDAEGIVCGPGQVGPRLAEALGWELAPAPKPQAVCVVAGGTAKLPAAIALVKAARRPIARLEAQPGARAVEIRGMELCE